MSERDHIAVQITKEAKDNTFVDSQIHGGVKISGSGTKMIRTSIFQFRRDHPGQFWTITGVVIAVIGVLVSIIK